MFDELRGSSIDGTGGAIHRNASAPQTSIPPGHVGPYVLPGSGRLVYWTGRVAIGLRHERRIDPDQPMSRSALWVQQAMLDAGQPAAAVAESI